MYLVDTTGQIQKVSCWYLYWNLVKNGGILHVDTWKMLNVPDRKLGGQGHPWHHGYTWQTPRRISWKFCSYIFVGSVSGLAGSFILTLGGCQGFLTWDLEDWVTFDNIDLLHKPQGSSPESYVWISLLEVCQEGVVKKGGTWRTLGVPEQRCGGQGHSWRHQWCFFYLKEHILKVLCPYLNWKCQEGGVKQEGTWRTLGVPDRRHGEQGHPWYHEVPFESSHISLKFQ